MSISCRSMELPELAPSKVPWPEPDTDQPPRERLPVRCYLLRQAVSPQKMSEQKKQNDGMSGSAASGSKFRCTWSNSGVRFSEIQSSVIHGMFSNEMLLSCHWKPLGTEKISLVFLILPLTCCLSQITSFHLCLSSTQLCLQEFFFPRRLSCALWSAAMISWWRRLIAAVMHYCW